MLNIPFTIFCTCNSSMNGISFASFLSISLTYSSLNLRLWARRFPAFTRPENGLFNWSGLSMDFEYFCARFFSRPLFGGIYLRLYFVN